MHQQKCCSSGAKINNSSKGREIVYNKLLKVFSTAGGYLKHLYTGTNFWSYTSSNAVHVLEEVHIKRIYKNAATTLEESTFIVVMIMINEQNKTGRKLHETESREWNYQAVIIKTSLFLCKSFLDPSTSLHLLLKYHCHQQNYPRAPCWHLGCCNRAGRMPLTESLDFPWRFPIQHYRAWLCLTLKIKQDLSQHCMATYFLNPPTSCHAKNTSCKCPAT